MKQMNQKLTDDLEQREQEIIRNLQAAFDTGNFAEAGELNGQLQQTRDENYRKYAKNDDK